MKQFAIIGLSKFGQRMLEELADTGCELILIDKDRQRVDQYKDQAAAVYVADALNEDVLARLVPKGIDAAIVDPGDQTEVSILVTHYLKKLGIREIIAKADSDEHEEILKLVGATRVVRPNTEAARRIAPFLISSLVFSYLPISKELVIEASWQVQTLARAGILDSFRGKGGGFRLRKSALIAPASKACLQAAH